MSNASSEWASLIRVRIAAHDGLPPGPVTTIELRVLPPFWARTEFLLFAATSLLLAAIVDPVLLTTGSGHVAALRADGSLDTNFSANLGLGFSDSVRAVLMQTDGRILVGGLFTNFNGAAVQRLADRAGRDSAQS